MQAPDTPVVFRVWLSRGLGHDVFALFPTLPADYTGRYCDSYGYGGHAAADYHGYVRLSRPARADECERIIRELTQTYGYQLRPIQRANSHHHDARRAEVLAWRAAKPTG
jgi:hypothetical protein